MLNYGNPWNAFIGDYDFLIFTGLALGIDVEILFERYEQKDCNRKPDPQGNAQIQIQRNFQKRVKIKFRNNKPLKI
jgi:hypothetical protein